MRDLEGDKVNIKIDDDYAPIVIDTFDRNGDGWLIPLDAKKTRKLARKLVAAADEIDPPAPVATAGSLGLCGPVVVKTPRYVLDLSVEEAETLAVILSRVGGSTGWDGKITSARKHAASIDDKLRSLGLEGVELSERVEYAINETRGVRGEIYFVDYPIADDEPDADPNEPAQGGCCGGVCS